MGTNLVKFSKETVRDVKQVARGWRWGRRPQVPRSAEPFVIPKETSVFPTKWARTPAAIALREVVQKGALNSVLRFEVNPQVSGLDALTKVNEPCLIVANHSSHLDTPLILCTLPNAWRRKTAVAAAADYFFDTWWRATASAIVFNTFPIERRSGKLSSTPGDLLADGWNVVVFPEGTRSQDGWMERFRMGAAYLAVEHGVPIIPVGIKGSFAAMPRGRGWPVPGRPSVAVRYGDALRPAPGRALATSRRASRPRSRPCSTKRVRLGGRPVAGSPRAPRPRSPGRTPPAGAGSGSPPPRSSPTATNAAPGSSSVGEGPCACWRKALLRVQLGGDDEFAEGAGREGVEGVLGLVERVELLDREAGIAGGSALEYVGGRLGVYRRHGHGLAGELPPGCRRRRSHQ